MNKFRENLKRFGLEKEFKNWIEVEQSIPVIGSKVKFIKDYEGRGVLGCSGVVRPPTIAQREGVVNIQRDDNLRSVPMFEFQMKDYLRRIYK